MPHPPQGYYQIHAPLHEREGFDEFVRGATALVGASDTSDFRTGDYATSGVAGQAAIDWTYGLGGGKVLWEAGFYNDIAATMEIPNAVVVEGMGRGVVGKNTSLRLANGANCDMFHFVQREPAGHDFFGSIKEMTLLGNSANQGVTSHCILINEFHSDVSISGLFITDFNGSGVRITNASVYFTWIYNNWIENNVGPGISKFLAAGQTFQTFIVNNILTYNEWGVYIDRGGDEFIEGNYVNNNDKDGIYVKSTGMVRINDNHVFRNGQAAANTYDEIFIWSGSGYIISNNKLGTDTLMVARTSLYITWGTRVLIDGNLLYPGQTERYHEDNSTTLTPSVPFEFTQFGGGSAGWTAPVINTSPGGIDLDGDNEFAYCHRLLPDDVQQVVNISIWAYSNVVEAANNMLLRIVVNGAGSSEGWATEPIDVANRPSVEEGGIVVTDVVHWIITAVNDSDIRDLAALDSLEIMAVGEAAVAPDIATDALFGWGVVKYV